MMSIVCFSSVHICFYAASCDTGFQFCCLKNWIMILEKPCCHTGKQNETGAFQDAGFAVVCHRFHGNWRIDKPCGFTVSGLEASGVLDMSCVWLQKEDLLWLDHFPRFCLLFFLNKNLYLVSVVITFFYTIVNYIFFTVPTDSLHSLLGCSSKIVFGASGFPLDISFYDQSQTS